MEAPAPSYSFGADHRLRETAPKCFCSHTKCAATGTVEVESCEPENPRTGAKALEKRWKDYFRDPSQWLDNRDSKTTPRAPDFRHSSGDWPLWIHSWSNPPWVREELRRRGLLTLPNWLAVQNEASRYDEWTQKGGTAKTDHLPDCEGKEEEKAQEDKVAMAVTSSPLIIQGNGGSCVSYSVLLKDYAQQKDLQRGTILHGELVQKGLLEQDIFVGSSLVNMYVKCGDLPSARNVFDNLPFRNLVCWNALIGGFSQYGHNEDALFLFKEMQQDGFPPDKVTFICVLKACGLLNAVEKGREIHAQISRFEYLSKDTFVGTAIVDMYGRFGMLATAQELFNMLLARNVVTWNSLIARYSDHGCYEDALACFNQMRQSGISPSSLTFLSTFKTCGSLEFVEVGQEVHSILIKEGFTETDLAVGAALADMYVKCDAFSKAEQVLNEFPALNEVLWNILITGNAQHGYNEEALNLFEQMQLGNASPDAITFTCVLKVCGAMEALQKGQEIHDQIARDGAFENDLSVAGALVDMYVKCGSLDEAKDVSDELSERNTVLWTTLIAGFANNERADEALLSYRQMLAEGVLPDIVTFACILKACGMAGVSGKGKEVHAQIIQDSSPVVNTIIGTAVLDMYARCGLLEKAQEVFNAIPHPNVITWNALIAGYTQHSQNEEALNCFERMQCEGFLPDSITFLSILKACGSLEATEKGQEIHAECVKDALLDEDVALGTALVDMYARCGMLADAQDLFDELPFLDIVSWNALISGYAQHSKEEALSVFDQMQCLGFSPNLVTFISIFRACCNLGTVDRALLIHIESVREGILEEDLAINVVLVDMYSNLGMLAEAHLMFDRLPWRDSVTWNVLLSGYAQFGNERMIFELFEQMKREEIQPDSFTFTILLNTCSHGGLMHKGQMCYLHMGTGYNVKATLEHVACIVDLFCRAGQVEEADAILQTTPFWSDTTIWHTVLAASKRWQIAELGAWAFEQAVQLDGRSAASYVCIANILAARKSKAMK